MGLIKILIEIIDNVGTILFGWILSDIAIQLAMHTMLAITENEWRFYTILFTFQPDITKYKFAIAVIKNLISNYF